nr:hypothetical protein [Candidatus Sigynarchaeota archaeon]
MSTEERPVEGSRNMVMRNVAIALVIAGVAAATIWLVLVLLGGITPTGTGGGG